MNEEEKQKQYELAEKLISEQNFTAAAIAGAVATLIVAVAYGIIVEARFLSYGFAAAGVGVVIGFFMRFLGRGISMKYSVLAAAYTIVGCVLGNLFVNVLNAAQANAASSLDVIEGSTLSALAQWSIAGLSLIHLVFWLVAVFAAVFLAQRPLSRAQRLAIGIFDLKA